MSNDVGSSTVDFGSWPGSNEASVEIAGCSAISATSYASAWLMAEASGAHTANDASYAALFMALTCTQPTDATGFTIHARSEYTFTGTFAVRWVWSD